MLEPYIKSIPDDVRALNNQGLALRGLNRFEEARRALKRARGMSTDDPMVLANLGVVLRRSRPGGRGARCTSTPCAACRAIRCLLEPLRRLPGGTGGKDGLRRARPSRPQWPSTPTTPKPLDALSALGRMSDGHRPTGGWVKAAHRRRSERSGRPRSGRRHPGRRSPRTHGADRVRELLVGRPARVRREPRAAGGRQVLCASRRRLPDLELHLIGPLRRPTRPAMP